MWRSTHPPSTCTQSTSASPLPQPLPAEKEEATKKGKAGAPKSLREGGPQQQGGDPGPLGPQGTLSRPVGLSSLQTALLKYPAHRTRCLPALPKSPSPVRASRHLSCEWEAQAVPQGPGGAGLGLWGWSAWRICAFFPELCSSREGVKEPL